MDPVLVIKNADAGTADEETLDAALAVLREHASVEVAATSSPDELDGVLHRAGSRRLVVAGGDGSLHAVVTALHRRHELDQHTLALLPLGTGNDFARGTGVPLEPEAAATLAVTGTPRGVDLLVDEVGGVVVNNVHAGAGARASRAGARWKERLGGIGVGSLNLGRLGYPIGTLTTAFSPAGLRLRVEVDGEVVNDVDQLVLMVLVGNSSHIGGGTEVTPDATPVDGKADVMVSRATTAWSKVGFLTDLVRAAHLGRDDVLRVRGREVRITGEDFWCSADGEIYGPERSRTWHLEPSAFQMVLPPL